ncbi:hypothetical protein kuro4_01620 [Gelria sp. Kuro-4]|nr:hypothetical protein kuro4_01620 [Gelria sp. Kuro-4]
MKDPASFVNEGRTGAANIGQVDHHLSSAAFITAVCSWFTDVYWVFSPSSTAKDRKTCLGSFKAVKPFCLRFPVTHQKDFRTDLPRQYSIDKLKAGGGLFAAAKWQQV